MQLLNRLDTHDLKTRRNRNGNRPDERQSCDAEWCVVGENEPQSLILIALVPVTMERGGEFIKIKGDPVRFMSENKSPVSLSGAWRKV